VLVQLNRLPGGPTVTKKQDQRFGQQDLPELLILMKARSKVDKSQQISNSSV